MVDKVLTSWN